MRRLTAYYLTRYGYYLGRGIAACRFLHADVRYGIGFVDDAMRRLFAKRIAHRVFVVQKAIGGNFRRANHAAAQVLNKLVRSVAVALAGELTDDGASGGSERNVSVLVAKYGRRPALRTRLRIALVADIAP